jgi:hypothetical protein
MVQSGHTSFHDCHHPPLYVCVHIELKLFSLKTGSGSESQHGINVSSHSALNCTTFFLIILRNET